MINNDGRAYLADFSLLAIAVASDHSTLITSCVEGGTIQWMSPELIDPESFDLKKIRPTKESDCYALGMVIYEVLSGQTPFAPRGAPFVIQKVLRGGRPERPGGDGGAMFTDGIWRMLELCWKHQPGDRTSVNAVLLYLEGTSLSPQTPSIVDGIAEIGTDERLNTTASYSGTCSPFHLRSQAHL